MIGHSMQGCANKHDATFGYPITSHMMQWYHMASHSKVKPMSMAKYFTIIIFLIKTLLVDCSRV